MPVRGLCHRILGLVLAMTSACYAAGQEAEKMTNIRQDVARKVFIEHPEMCREDRRQAVLKGIIELGMTPYEAKLAGGEFSYKVIADTAVWPPNTDPIKVMWFQSLRPDGSKMWMTFRNASQFEGAGEEIFTVYFLNGQAKSIDRRGR